MNLVEITRLWKRYGTTVAVQDINLKIEAGAIFGFIGPNGAGKTSTLKILATLLEPSSGDAWVGGYSVRTEPRSVRRVIGYMPDFFGVYQNMRVGEYLDFYAACYKIPASKARKLAGDLLDLMDLGGKRNEYVDVLSRGMKQKLCLARTLMHDPALLILDEPASGLDPRARIENRELLKELRLMGKTILISSHILADLAEVCTDVGIIDGGKLLAAGKISALLGHHTVRVTLLDRLEEGRNLLLSHPLVDDVQVQERTLLVTVKGTDEENIAGLLSLLVGAGLKVLSFSEEPNLLENVFLRVTEGVPA